MRVTSVHRAPCVGALPCQSESRMGSGFLVQHEACCLFADGRSVLETMARPAADNPDIVVLRVSIDEEVAVRRVLVLTDARLHDRCAFHGREPTLQPRTRALHCRLCDDTVVAIGIDRRAMLVDANLEASIVDVG